MKKYKRDRKRYKLQFEEKKSIRKFNVTAKARAERNGEIKEKPDFQCNKGKVTLRQDLTQLSFQVVKGKGLKNPLLLERNNKQKCT